MRAALIEYKKNGSVERFFNAVKLLSTKSETAKFLMGKILLSLLREVGKFG